MRFFWRLITPESLLDFLDAGLADFLDAGLRDFLEAGLSDFLDAGLADFLDAGLSDFLDAGLSDFLDAGLPDFLDDGLSDFLDAGLPDLLDAGLSDFLDAGLADFLDAGLSDFLDEGLRDFLDAGLPEEADLAEEGDALLERPRLTDRSEAADLTLPERTERGLPECFEAGDGGERERTDVGLPECADFEEAERADSALTDLADFGLSDVAVFGLGAADGDLRLFALLWEVSEPDGLGDRLDLALAECSEGVLSRCDPAGLGLLDFCEGELDRERDDLEVADAWDTSEPAGLGERLGEWSDAEPSERAETADGDLVRSFGERGDADRSQATGLWAGVGDSVRTGDEGDLTDSASSSLSDLGLLTEDDLFRAGDDELEDGDPDRAAGDADADLDSDLLICFRAWFEGDSVSESDCLPEDDALLSESDAESRNFEKLRKNVCKLINIILLKLFRTD